LHPGGGGIRVAFPGTYAAGVYNELADVIAGRTIENESLVNLPNWLALTFRINGGAWFHIDDVELLSYRQTFDLRHATPTRTLRFRDSAGQITTLAQQRFTSMHQPHVVTMRTTIVAENCSGTVEFRSLLDGAVGNTMVERYRSLSSIHLTESATEEMGSDSVILRTRTSQSRIAIAVAARSTAWPTTCGPTRDTRRSPWRRSRPSSPTGMPPSPSRRAPRGGTSRRRVDMPTFIIGTPGRGPGCGNTATSGCPTTLSDNTVALRVLRLHLVHLLQTISPHPPTSTPGSRPAGCTVRPIGGTSSGTRCSSPRC